MRVALVAVSFTEAERADYEDLSRVMSAARARLVSSHLAPAEPIGLFLEAVARLARSGAPGDRAAMLARQYLGAMQDRRRLRAVTAPQVLDEGVDVPAADLGIILAASRSRRQMVQRMGRVLRRKPDGRPARFAVVFVEGTTEDPALGAHVAFLDEVTAVADTVVTFPTAAGADEVSSFLVERSSTRGLRQ